MLAWILENAGFDTITEINSLNVYKLIETERPDLLLLDLWMPVLSGDQVLRMLKLDPKTSSLLVIIISASMEGRAIATQTGASELIAKPFDGTIRNRLNWANSGRLSHPGVKTSQAKNKVFSKVILKL